MRTFFEIGSRALAIALIALLAAHTKASFAGEVHLKNGMIFPYKLLLIKVPTMAHIGFLNGRNILVLSQVLPPVFCRS